MPTHAEYARRRAEGLCPQCVALPVHDRERGGRTRCIVCAMAQQIEREERRAADLCVDCGRPRDPATLAAKLGVK